MAIRLTLECGHASILRERHTSDGFTHDWEVFVRGVDNADIHHYIEKVVFQLHETFTKPKRVLKEPPYVVKESGYAGFLIPIHVYLKNKDEPKRFQILYKLHLQQRGRVINKVVRHIEIINNPSEEFRRKLLKGGGVVLSSTESTSDRGGEIKAPVMVGKPKLPVGEPKKHRLVESKTSNSFAELFGPPIKTAKISPESKKTTQPEKSTAVKPLGVTEKSDKVDKITKSKDSPHKDTKKEKTEERKDKKVKDASKEKSRSKEKSKRPSSPGSKVYSSPTSKRPSSPPPVKKPRSPSPPSSIKRPLSPKSKEKDVKRPAQEKEREKEREKEKEKEKEKDKDKDRDKDKSRDSSKSSLDINKTEKKKDKKKHKEDRDKEKKEKYKEGERSSIKEPQKINDKKFEKVERSEKEKGQDYKSVKDGRKSPKPLKEGDKVKDDKLAKVEKFDKGEKSEKVKENKSDKDRQKHKHKKKDKKEKRDSSREREKKEKREKSKSSAEKQNNVPPASNPLSMLLQDMRERDSSDSAPSVDEESFVETKPAINVKKEMEDPTPLTLPLEATRPPSPPPLIEIKKEKSDRSKREKPKGNRGEERESRKRKRRSESKGDDEHNIKREKDRSHSASPLLEPVSSSQSPVAVDVDSIHNAKDKEDRNVAEQVIKKEGETDAEQVAPDSTNCPLAESDIGEPPVFSEDYVSQLKDLQHKIMTLQDNQELQRVVRVIEETGQYEITKKTFDFDLCALDRRTVQRLQQFFTAS